MARTSSVTFYQNVNLDTSSGNTYYFANRSAQLTFFATKLYKTVSATSYQRENRQYIRVNETMANMLHCDYLSFKNPQYENKTFYCFITGINYINDNCTEIIYEIDILQTWLLDLTFKPCMIERNHTATDNIFSNLIPDDFSPGDMLTGYQRNYSINRFSVIFQATFDIYEWVDSDFATKAEPKVYNRSTLYDGYSMLGCEVYKSSSNYAANGSMFAKMLDAIFQTTGNVSLEDFTNIWIYPTDLVQHVDTKVHHLLDDNTIDQDLRSYWKVGNAKRIVDYFVPQLPTTLDGYTPRNKKLFTYPYFLLHVTNCDGSAKDIKFERFNTNISGGTYPFVLSGTTTNEGKIRLTPGDYMGVNDANITNAQYDPSDYLSLPYEESIDSMAFPVVSVIGDVYNIYYAQNHTRVGLYFANEKESLTADLLSFILNPVGNIAANVGSGGETGGGQNAAVGGAVGGGGGAAAGMVLSKFAEGAQYVARREISTRNTLAAWNDMKTAPNEAKGLQSVGLAYQNGYKGFIFEVKTCDRYRAESIDCFFDMYGYPIKKIANPGSLLNNRPSWTFIKTVGCSVSGTVPENVKSMIESLFDVGLRFWNSSVPIGDYSQSNTPVTP